VIEDLRPCGRPASRPGERPVRMAVVGLGYWGPNLVRNLHELSGADVAWACDLRAEALAPLEHRYPALATTTRFANVLEDPTTDAVAIVTPVGTHYELAAAALRAGKHVFVEKPLAASSGDALDLIRLAEREGLVVMPGHTFLYSPPVNLVRDLIGSGELGEIYFISTSRVNLGLHQPDVSVVWDLGAHDLSILRYWLGENPIQVTATSRGCIMPGTPDVAFINLRFATETIAHVELSWLAPSKLRRTAIVGSRKMVVYDDTSNEPVRVFDSGVTVPEPETFGEYQLTYRTGDIVSPHVAVAEPLSLELLDFCSAVRLGSEPRSSARLGLDVVRIIEAVDQSLASGGSPVSVDEVGVARLS
jgi:predicted dehydrogenase